MGKVGILLYAEEYGENGCFQGPEPIGWQEEVSFEERRT